MKTYLLDSINRYKRFSENLDVKTILCNKSWWVFNDSGEKEIYIFQEDESLIISINGQVTNANWKFISANKSLIINTAKQSVMVHSAFMDNVIFALQLDGTNQFAFLIDESNRDSFQPKSLDDVKNYFATKELREEAEKNKQIEQTELERKRQVQLEKRRQKEKTVEQKLQTIAYSIKSSEHYKKWKKCGRSWFSSGYFILGILASTAPLTVLFIRLLEFIPSFFVFFPIIFAILIGVSTFLWERRDNKKNFELKFRKKNGEYVMYEGSQYNFDNFNLWCLEQTFSTFTVTMSDNREENISSYMQGAGMLEISYMYKGEKIAVDCFDLDSIN
jgi:hypothetical protein